MLFHVLRSTAVGIQPIRAIKKAKPAPSQGVKSGGGLGTVCTGVFIQAAPNATTVLRRSTAAIHLIKLSNARYLPTVKSTVAQRNTPIANPGVALICSRSDAPKRLSKKAAVTMPTAPMTKKHVPVAMMK